MKVLEEDRSRDYHGGVIGFGDVGLVAQATIFKKIKRTFRCRNSHSRGI